ncbi:MAG: EAL domain-containing protein [Gammaproteobacteria bacterium]|nr:EAL domain-containing protein [Gammaproteobacteria bacterium]
MSVFSGLRARLLWLVLLAVLPALALILYQGHRSGQTAARQALDRAEQLVNLARTDFGYIAEETRALLSRLPAHYAARLQDPRACGTLLADLKNVREYYVNLGVVAPNGDLLCAARPADRRVNFSDRPWFRQTLEERRFAIGEYVIGRIARKPVVTFALPHYAAGGRLEAVYFAAFDLTWFNRIPAHARLPEGSTIVVLDSQGTVLSRHPEHEHWLGKRYDTPITRFILANPGAGRVEAEDVDGVPRLYAYAPLVERAPGASPFIAVGIPTEIAYADVRHTVVNVLGGLAFVLALVLAAAWYGGDVFLLRKIRALVDATRRLGQGELGARTGLAHGRDEIGQLAGAFDEMAATLHARNTEFARVMESLGDSEERFRTLVETTSDWIWEADARGVYTYASPKVKDLLGYAPEEVVGKTPFDFMPPDEAAKLRQQFADIATARRPFEQLENVNLRKDGRRVVIETSGVPIFDREGGLAGWRGVDRDITERIKAQEKLRYLAYHDELTDLPNRALLLDRLRQGLIETTRHDRRVAAMCLDLRDFKNVNDTLGHEIGNRLLQAVAERLQTCVRPGDTVARLDGDKFGVMLADVSQNEDVVRVMQKIREDFTQPLRVDGHELCLSMTFGISLYPSDGTDAETLLKNADIAMYRARERDDDYQYYSADMTASAAERLALENDLRRVLERSELCLYYQPQVGLASGAITGVEALIRWQHPAHGMISPEKFIPLAEQTGLVLPIGEWVLRQACAQARAWQAAGWPLRMSINLSARQFRLPGLDGLIRGILEETGLDPGRLDIELTESIIVRDPATVAAILTGLERLGVQISIDDFGTGYSSLSYLKRFPIDILKIDQSFVRDLATDPDDAAIVQAIVTMAHALGIQTIAEGVETKAQLELLRRNGCDAMQGYYFSRPVPAEEIARLLREQRRLDL